MNSDSTISQSERSTSELLRAMDLLRRSDGRVLLDHVSLAISGGDRVAVIGPTGSGKSLLLRSLAKLDPLDAGEIFWRGNPIPSTEIPKFRSNVIYLHQRPATVDGTVESNLRVPFSWKAHRNRTFQKEPIIKMLDSLGRDESFLEKSQQDLSGGELQLMALMRALQFDPQVLLLDEPTAALDATSTQMVETLVLSWAAEKPSQRSFLWVTHDPQQPQRVANSTLKIHDGKLAEG